MHTIAETIATRMQQGGLADLLLTVYDAGYCAGAGVEYIPPRETSMADLLVLLAERHRVETLALRGWLDPPTDDPPAWLLAEAERQHALGDAQAPAELSEHVP